MRYELASSLITFKKREYAEILCDHISNKESEIYRRMVDPYYKNNLKVML
jgi:hypothetical protein